ncbi:hypothetical protein B0H14DRAFT_3859424 [Mycena olivaceomarginata]|nr:hypothetical protein B0H14DRAFT_3859424 [Mycena olivaceomarginata]
MKQPSRYYSADPTMFCSSMVMSVVGSQISRPHADLIRSIILKYGGQWAATPTENLTHLIADKTFDYGALPPCISIVVSHEWVRDSFEKESSQELGPYVLFKRDGDAPSTFHRTCPAAYGRKAKATARVPDQRQLPFLPVEIVVKIHLMSRDLALDELRSYPYINTLLRISQVCQRWRTIAHDNSALWTHLFLDFHTKKAFARLSKLAEVGWIARSGSCPLSVNIRSYFRTAPNPAINFILVHASRIRELSLQLPAAQFHQFLRLKAGTFPVLEQISMSATPRSSCVFDPTMGMTREEFFADEMPYGESDPELLWADLGAAASVFRNTPKLHNVTIEAHCGGIDPLILRLPWASLTDIDIGSVEMGVNDTREVLQLLVNVLSLSFCTGPSQGRIMPRTQSVRLPVRQLTWRGLFVSDVTIFAPLILSNLTSLDLRDASDASLRLLRERAPFNLEKLDLVFTRLTFSATAAFIREMHALTSLDLRLSIALTDELMEFLTFDAHRPVLPALTDLFLFDHRKYFDERIMLRMVESRWQGAGPCAPPLRKLSISTKPPLRGFPGSGVFESRAVVPPGLAVVPLSPPSIRRGILDRIAEMNEEGLSFKYEIVV